MCIYGLLLAKLVEEPARGNNIGCPDGAARRAAAQAEASLDAFPEKVKRAEVVAGLKHIAAEPGFGEQSR